MHWMKGSHGAALASLLALAGCADQSPDEVAYVAALDNHACADFERGTPEYRGCRELIDRRRDQARRERVGLAISKGLQAYSEAQARAAASQPRQTTCTATGAVLNCTTY